jgi:hypothetical protein
MTERSPLIESLTRVHRRRALGETITMFAPPVGVRSGMIIAFNGQERRVWGVHGSTLRLYPHWYQELWAAFWAMSA